MNKLMEKKLILMMGMDDTFEELQTNTFHEQNVGRQQSMREYANDLITANL